MSGREAVDASLPLPRSLEVTPRLSRWVQVLADGVIEVRVGKVELGQGITTALAQIAADELGVDVGQIRMLAPDTVDAPNEGLTAGSMSIVDSGAALRLVCAEVRAAFVAAAVERRELEQATVTVSGGIIADAAGHHTTYGDMASHVGLDRDAEGSVALRSDEHAGSIGVSVARLDLPDKVAGRPRFIHDLELAGQLYGRVVRPPSPGACLLDVELPLPQLDGVITVVRDGSFLGVVAVDEHAAGRAAEALRLASRWQEQDTLPDENDLPAFLRTGRHQNTVIADRGEPATPASADQHSFSATYNSSFLAHASIAPSCGAALWSDGRLQVWTHSQGIYPLRSAIVQALELDADAVTVRHVEGAGCYGHNPADDAAFDAVLLARAVPERPVHVRWTRADELSWGPFGSAMSIDLAATLDPAGHVSTWSHEVWSQGHTSRPGYAATPGLLAHSHREGGSPLVAPLDPPKERGYGSARNSVPIYRFERCRVMAHRLLEAPMRTSALRSLGAFANVFAIESFIDELSLAVGRDPLEYRLEHLDDPRAKEVLLTAARAAGWAQRADGRQESVGHGIGFARYKDRGAYCAVIAEVEAVAALRVRRLTVAVDVGLVINPDGVRNQLEGGAVQATSWTTKERVRFDRRRITSTDWDSYPILRFSEAPVVAVTLVDRPDEPSLGAGEAAQGPTAAAIANAVADALSVRVRSLPITSDAILAAADA